MHAGIWGSIQSLIKVAQVPLCPEDETKRWSQFQIQDLGLNWDYGHQFFVHGPKLLIKLLEEISI